MSMLAFIFQLALELYNKCRGSSFALLHTYLVANIATDEFLQKVYLKCSAITSVSLFFSITTFIFSTKLKHDACYTLMNVACWVI